MFLFLLAATASARTPNDQSLPADIRKYFVFDDPSPLACLETWFPPLLIQHGMEMKDFVRSATFTRIRDGAGDRRAIDAMYVRAMQLTNNNTAAALLISTLASFEHDLVGIDNPLFKLSFPLTDESREEFSGRIANLPAKIYDDSPPEGDRDKLQHFFGSAFIAFIGESNASADRFGMFVEKGERAFIVGGMYDNRDLRADDQGGMFGGALLRNNRLFPSSFIAVPSLPAAPPLTPEKHPEAN